MTRRPVARCLCYCALVGLAACKDAPTAPRVLELVADGKAWAAVSPPASLPSALTWVPYLARSGPAGEAAARRVRALELAADSARADGRFEQSTEIHREARRVALGALSVAPDAAVVRESLWAVDEWLERTRDARLASLPAMAASVDSVKADRAAAAAALADGDTLAGVAHVMAASDLIRAWTPEEIAVRVLARATHELRAMNPDDPAESRADHLAAGARLELTSGSAFRSLRRALYALQLTNGALVDTLDANQPGDCVNGGC